MFRKKRKNSSFPASETTRIKWVRQLAEERLDKPVLATTLMAEPEATMLQLVEDYIYWRKLGYEPHAALSIIDRGNRRESNSSSVPTAHTPPPEPWDLSCYASYVLRLMHVKQGGMSEKEIDRVLKKFLNAYKMRGACDEIKKSAKSEDELCRSKRKPLTNRIAWRTKIECPQCGQRIGVSTADLGQSAPCPNCKVTLDVPAITQRCVPLRDESSSQLT